MPEETRQNENRKIIHVDMDAFFASVEQRDFPQLKGKPVVVGGDPKARGVVAAASYEARKYGIHSAMASALAVKLCPEVTFVKSRFGVYQTVSDQIRAIFHEYTDLVEPLSLDEAYLDVTVNKKRIKSATILAMEILSRIQSETKLTASAGVGPNKFVAKVASAFQKPKGLTVIPPEEVLEFIENLPISKFYGVGKKTEEKMLKLGINNGKTLSQWPLEELRRHFGKMGGYYYNISRGIDNRLVEPHRIRKSIGTERTFRKDISSSEEYADALEFLADELYRRLNKKKRSGHTLTLKIKDANFKVTSKQISIEKQIADKDTILKIGTRLIDELLSDPFPIRLMGLTINNLDDEDNGEREMPQLELPL